MIIPLSEMMKGVPAKDTTFPQAIVNLGAAYTYDDGFYMEDEDAKEKRGEE